jgi:hypothetical protein
MARKQMNSKQEAGCLWLPLIIGVAAPWRR